MGDFCSDSICDDVESHRGSGRREGGIVLSIAVLACKSVFYYNTQRRTKSNQVILQRRMQISAMTYITNILAQLSKHKDIHIYYICMWLVERERVLSLFKKMFIRNIKFYYPHFFLINTHYPLYLHLSINIIFSTFILNMK